ncbi:MAG: lipopolysaccharide heptosyltransferase II [Phycisphaerales bacterium]|nr:lipopolysaccharide heptosyltransferase II [Phycisphaerales bacterium]
MTVTARLAPDVTRIAVVLPSWVGDVVMATPVFRALRAHRPDTRIVALHRPGLADLLAGDDAFDDAIPLPKVGAIGLLAQARLVRRQGFEAVVLLPNSLRAALLARLAGIPRRIGYARDRRRVLLTDAVTPPREPTPMPAVDFYATLGEAVIGAAITDRRPRLTVTDAERDDATTLLEGVGRPFVVLNPGASKVAKRWPGDRFAAVADALADAGRAIVLSGSPTERADLDAIAARMRGPATVIAGRVTLGSLKAVLAEAALLVTNDTGPRHVAAAVGCASVVLFGPTDPRWTTLPGVREHLLRAEPFLPEDRIADRFPTECAIDRIPVADVVFAARRLLDGSA